MLDSVVHLGNYQTMNLSDDLDIQMKSMDVIKQPKTALLRFNFVDSILKTRLFQSYCLSFYGGALWRLSSRQIKGLEVSYNKILHQIWSLSCMCITYCYCSPGCCIVSQYLKVACKALNHDSVLCLSALLSHVLTLLAIIFCTVHITPEFIMTTKDSVVKLFHSHSWL